MENLDIVVLRTLKAWREAGQKALLTTVVRTWGSSPRPVGSIMALCEDGAVWVVPEARMKLGVPHVVPLSRQAQALLEQLRLLTGGSELVLESPLACGKPLSENTFLFALYRLGYRGRMTAHGFRALASTVLNEQSSFAHDVIERQLAHKEVDEVRAAYNRAQYLPQRRQLMQ